MKLYQPICMHIHKGILTKIERHFREQSKFMAFYLFLLLWCTLPLPFMVLRPFDTRNYWFTGYMGRLTSKLLGIDFTVRGLHNIDISRGSVVLANHQSTLDVLALAEIATRLPRITTVVKRSLMFAGPFGLANILWGTIFIDRGARSALKTLSKQVNLIRTKGNIVIFPEGTRNASAKMLPFKKGAFHMALQAGAPILPMVISKHHFIIREKRRFGSGTVILSFLPMIETKELTVDDIPTLIEKIQNEMQEEYTRISAETLKDGLIRNENSLFT